MYKDNQHWKENECLVIGQIRHDEFGLPSIPTKIKKRYYILLFKAVLKLLLNLLISRSQASPLQRICQNIVGLFFFLVSVAHELINLGKYSEMNIVLDLWLNTIYKDD